MLRNFVGAFFAGVAVVWLTSSSTLGLLVIGVLWLCIIIKKFSKKSKGEVHVVSAADYASHAASIASNRRHSSGGCNCTGSPDWQYYTSSINSWHGNAATKRRCQQCGVTDSSYIS